MTMDAVLSAVRPASVRRSSTIRALDAGSGPLHPAADAFAAALDRGVSIDAAWDDAIAAAEAGLAATASMHPRLGRASYLGERAIGSPDAGAAGVVVWMRAMGGRGR